MIIYSECKSANVNIASIHPSIHATTLRLQRVLSARANTHKTSKGSMHSIDQTGSARTSVDRLSFAYTKFTLATVTASRNGLAIDQKMLKMPGGLKRKAL